MSYLDDLEEIAPQSDIRVNQKTRGRRGAKIGNFSHLPDNIARAAVRVEHPKPAPLPLPTAAPAAPPIVSTRNSATLGRLFNDYRTLIETCRARAEELALSRLELDRLAKLPDGYSAKILGKEENAKDAKRIWPKGLGAMLDTLGLKMILILDETATARTLALRTPVESNQQRFENVSRISAKRLPPPSQPATPPMLTVVSGKRRGKYG
jgi:hypothetical protein